MPDARNLADLSQVFPMVPAGANASAPTTASGSWVDTENWIGDAVLVVNVGSVTGSFGSLKVQIECSAANTGTSPSNCADPRNAGLLTITALGTYVMPFNVDQLPLDFVGVACTYTGITAATFSAEIIGRKQAN